MLPGGISFEFSCRRMRCQLANLDDSGIKVHRKRLLQVVFEQISGSVYLNCCSTFRSIPVTHSLHWNVPTSNSGRTYDVGVIVPLMLTSCPSLRVVNSLNLK